MGGAGGAGKRRGHADQLRPLLGQIAVKLREAQIIANGHAQGAKRRLA